jgi:hypothetical protein
LTINLSDVDEAHITIETLDAKPEYQFWADKEEATDTTGGVSRRESEISAHWISEAQNRLLEKVFAHAESE